MFIFKKIIGPCFDPLSVCLVLLVAGVLVLWATRRQRLGKVLVSVGVAALIFAGYGWFSRPFVERLESKYPALLEVDKASGVKWIVVLGYGVVPDKKLPPNSQLCNGALARLVEGIRIHRALPGTRIILSGGPPSGGVPEAEAMARTAAFLGVDRQKLVLDSTSKDTEDQARLIKRMIGDEKFILVTSAVHMPRSVALAQKQGLHPIPAPADYIVKENAGTISPAEFFPGSGSIAAIELAMHEYLGMVWAKLRGRI